MIVERLIIARDGRHGLAPRRWFVERETDQRLLRLDGALRDTRHAAEGNAGISDVPPVEREPESAERCRDVLVETLRDLIGAKDLAGLQLRQSHPAHELARQPVLLAIGDE